MEARLDDLQYKGLFLYQRPDLPRFTQDSVLLAAFAELTVRDVAVDIGAGSGALSLLCGARTGAKFTAIEKDAALCELLRKSAAYNHVELPVVEADWADAPRLLGCGGFTAALCNPPYYAAGTQSPDETRALARGGAHALKGAVLAASRLLKNGGRLYLCYPADRLTDVLVTLRENRLEPKRLRLVARDAKSAPYLALIMAQLNARPHLDVQPVLFLKDENGNESGEYRRIYHIGESEY
jgi:tRNA1Val (adenine37-N6)-methyltransferase